MDQDHKYYDDDEYDSSYHYYEQEEAEEEQGMPDFECQEDMHRWMLAHAEVIAQQFLRMLGTGTPSGRDVIRRRRIWMEGL